MKKKNTFCILPLLMVGLVMMLTSRCSKDDDGNTPGGTVTDIDGNVYHTVTIGTQVWLVENLKTTKYRNGDVIPNVADDAVWAGLTTGAYCSYDNEPDSAKTYGRLYNWRAVDDSRNIAPAGWHVPTDAEWTTLTNYLTDKRGGIDIAKPMAATFGWETYATVGAVGNDQSLNNSTGFTALSGGYRDVNGSFASLGHLGYWWSATASGAVDAWSRYIAFSNSGVYSYDYSKTKGFSVRCVKDK